MVKVMYEDVLVGEVTTNKSLTVDEALNLIDFDEQEFLEEQGWDDIDYNEFKLVYDNKEDVKMGNKTISFEGINLKITEEVENGKVEAVSPAGNLYYLHFKEGKPVKLEDRSEERRVGKECR